MATLAALLGLLVLVGQAVGAPSDPPHLNWGSEVNPGQCPNGQLVINVTHKVTNDVDSRVGGGVWAFDNYNKQIQVWQVGANTFCAVVRYEGSFTTIAGPSPEGTDPNIAAGIRGAFEGGYRADITGTLNPNPSYRTRGNIGAFDYGCAATDPGDHSSCTGLFSWLGTYFTSVSSFDQPWWGWVYHGGRNGTWVNAVTGNQGDITD